MKTVAIICEYDPFHRGHKKQIDLIREHFGSDTTVISLMSGSTVQRGRLSVYPKHIRAEAAIKCGADLVLELPAPYSCSSAEHFAFGAVSILSALGEIDVLAFGSESGNIEALTKAAYIINSEEYLSALRDSDETDSHIRTAEEIFLSLGGEDFPSSPNDILAVEYIAALLRLKSDITTFTYRREEGYSATLSRKVLNEGGDASQIIPPEALDVFSHSSLTDTAAYEAIALHTVRNTPSDILSSFYGMNGGVSGLIQNRAENTASLFELITKCTCRSYTSSRIRRAVLSSVLGITSDEVKIPPLFTNLLGANEKGRCFLNLIRKKTAISIITKPADGMNLPDEAKKQFETNLRADKLMALCRGEATSCNVRTMPVLL